MPNSRHLSAALLVAGLAVLGCGRTEGPAPAPTAGKPAPPAPATAVAHQVVLDIPGMT